MGKGSSNLNETTTFRRQGCAGRRRRSPRQVYIPLWEADLRGVIGQVQEEAHVFHGAVLLKVRLEEAGSFHVHLQFTDGEEGTYVADTLAEGKSLTEMPKASCMEPRCSAEPPWLEAWR